MNGQPIDLAREYDKRPARAWHDPGAGPWDHVHVYLGQLADGRWYTATTERAVHPRAMAWPTREDAEEHVAELLSTRTGWVDAPAWYDSHGQPHGELGPWRQVGRHWVLDD